VDSFRDLFGGHRDELIYFHSPARFLANLDCPQRLSALRGMDIVLVVGNEDPFLDHTRSFSHLLWSKGIWHALHVWDGRAHRGHDWRRMAPLYV
jgi:esterase/lipase superfamily enzyme